MRLLLIGLAVAISLGLAGWGVALQRLSDDEGDVQRAQPPTAVEAEAFARFRLPASARALQIREENGIDQFMSVRFEIDRDDVDPLLAASGLTVEPVARALHGVQQEPGYNRELTILLDRPGVASVHLTAFTT